MDLTPEEMKEGIRKFLKREEQNKYYAAKEEEYRGRTATNNLQLDIQWADRTEAVDVDFLVSRLTIDGFENFEENFMVINLDLDQVVNYVCEGEDLANEMYSIDKLWDTNQCETKIIDLITYVEEGKIVCPPVIDVVSDSGKDLLVIYDGNHRIALSRYLRLVSIPFIVRRTNELRIRALL
ncbi:hypothetical protein [Flavobacterium sp.]|uniref:hypothetical protein n=1 Tax=Flavobacterium sp. TaxID=239 RepID=UPI0031D11D10